MRGMSRLRTIRSDDRGGSLALVALSLGWIVGMTALVIDVGNGWLTRQSLIPATDAAALAAAQDLVDRPWDEAGACATADAYVAVNAPDSTMTGCEVASSGDGGRITVSAAESFDTYFADPGHVEGRSPHSVSTATWGPPLTVSGLRPLGLCYDGSFDLRQLIDHPPSGPTRVTVRFLKDDPAGCGGLSFVGNFLTLDYDGGTPLGEIRDWTVDGYPGKVGFENPTATGCHGGVTCYERPWALFDLTTQLASLRDSGSYVPFPVFDYADASEVHLVGMIRARLHDFDLVGPWWQYWSLELEVDPGLVVGTCCGPPGLLSGNRVVAICGVDPGAFQACEPTVGP